MADPAQIARSLTKAQRERIVDARWHEWTKTWRVIVSGRTEAILREKGLLNERVFPGLSQLGEQVRTILLQEHSDA